MFDEIYLEPDEEVTSAIEKVKKAKKDAVVLVLPRQSVLGQSIVNLKLLLRQSVQASKQLALVSPDPVVRGLAERVGFAVFAKTDEVAIEALSASKKEPVTKEARKEDQTPEQKTDAKAPSPQTKPEVTAPVLASAGFTAKAVAQQPVALPDDADAAVATPEVEKPVNAPQEAPAVSPPSRHADRPMIPSRGNLRFYRQQKRKSLLVPLALILGLILVSLAGVAIAVPKATVAITVVAQPFKETINSTVAIESTAIDVEKATIPGKLVTADHITKLSAQATGKKDMGTKATGTVTLYNEWDNAAHDFPAGTTLRAKSGQEFVLTTAVSVPGASSTLVAGSSVITPGKKTATIEAAQPGESYNLAATTFTLPGLPKAQQEKIYASSTEALTGGTSNVVTVVTQTDIDKLSENAKKLNKDEATAKLKQAAADLVVIENAVQYTTDATETSVAANTQADAVEVTVTGKATVIGFSAADQQSLLEQLLANKIPTGQKLVTSGDGVGIDASQFELNLASENKLEITNNLKAFTVNHFDEATIRRNLVGASPADVQTIVNKVIATDAATVTVSPSAWPRLPYWSKNITLTFTYKGNDA